MNLVEYIFRRTAELDRWQEVAIACDSERLTYEQLLVRIQQFASVLVESGVSRGDRVAIVAHDCPEFVIAFLGSVAAGAVAVPASTMMNPSELSYVVNHSGARTLVVSSDQLSKMHEVNDELSDVSKVLLVDGETDDSANFATTVYAALPRAIEPIEDEALAFILYTSGSTGRPKGALHVHRNLPYTVETCCKTVLDVQPEDRLFSSSRLFFAYGLGNSLSFPLSSSALSILSRERPTPEVIARVFSWQRPTIFFAVPAVFSALIAYVESGSSIDTASVRFCVSAGEKLPERVFHEWKELTGLDTLDGIGSTEMLQMFISNTRDSIRPGSSGRVIPGYEAKLVDQQGSLVEGEGTGNLFIKGGSSSSGYWNDPAKTSAMMVGGWMRTGDLYRRDSDDYYWFEGRSDDLFKVKGLWVSPVEVEDALLCHPGIVEAAVVPVVGDEGMNLVAAYVVLRPGSSDDPEAFKSHVRSILASFKCPTEIYTVDSLPRTATGKLQRYKLRSPPSA